MWQRQLLSIRFTLFFGAVELLLLGSSCIASNCILKPLLIWKGLCEQVLAEKSIWVEVRDVPACPGP